MKYVSLEHLAKFLWSGVLLCGKRSVDTKSPYLSPHQRVATKTSGPGNKRPRPEFTPGTGRILYSFDFDKHEPPAQMTLSGMINCRPGILNGETIRHQYVKILGKCCPTFLPIDFVEYARKELKVDLDVDMVSETLSEDFHRVVDSDMFATVYVLPIGHDAVTKAYALTR